MLGTFGVPLDAIAWVAVAYSIAEMIMTTMAAWWGVLLGRKRFYILSFAFFTASLGVVRSGAFAGDDGPSTGPPRAGWRGLDSHIPGSDARNLPEE